MTTLSPNDTVCQALLKQVGETRASLKRGALLRTSAGQRPLSPAAGVGTGLPMLTQVAEAHFKTTFAHSPGSVKAGCGS